MDTKHDFIMAITVSDVSLNDINYLDCFTVFKKHTKTSINKVYADKGFAGKLNRDLLAENKIDDGILRKESTTVKLKNLVIAPPLHFQTNRRYKKLFSRFIFNRGPIPNDLPTRLTHLVVRPLSCLWM